MRRFVKKHRVATAALGFILALSLGAVASWLVTGSGQGFAKAGTPVALTTLDIPSASLTGDLFPSGQGSLSIKIQNNNGFPVTITEVASAGTIISDNGAACASSNVTWVQTPKTGLTLGPVPASGSATVVVPNAVTLAANAPTTCQGMRFMVPVSLTGISG